MGKVAKSVGDAIGDAVSSVGHAVSKASKSVSKGVKKIGSRTIRVGKGLVKSVNKEVIKPVVKNVVKPINEEVIKPVIKKGVEIGKNIVESPINAVKSLAKGDVLGALTNLANVATYGTVDATGKGKGIVNIDTKKELAKVMGVNTKKQDLGTSGTGAVSIPQTYKTGKSGLLQLRQGKGTPGGGSYTEIAKNPLGGTAGKTGK